MGPEILNLSPEEYALYTYYGGDEMIAAFAREIIWPGASYWEQIQMIYDSLKYGEFRYSLRPGIAPDGDQLKHFLFTSQKGYCSYFAFAFTLMLRSLGIPSRIAAGFYMDPNVGAFIYYPVRADMAHAWSEVWFPGYGWIEYDPTTPILAEGEEFRFSQGTPPELFERLMKEILENRSGLRVRERDETGSAGENLAALGRRTLGFFAQYSLCNRRSVR
jgi:transglutaminase-like putative cysteine protease